MSDVLWPDGKAPKEFWQNPDHRRWYLGWLGEQLGYREPDDWYQLTAADFQAHQGGELLTRYYQNSPAVAVKNYFPKIDWHEWLFAALPDGFWEHVDHRCRYMRWLGEQCGYVTADDWRRLTVADFKRFHGEDLLRDYYDNSPLLALREYLPEHDWHEWLFLPPSAWDDRAVRRRYMEWLGEQLGYQTPDAWYAVEARDFETHYGGDLLAYYQHAASLAVFDLFPGHAWQPERFAQHLAQQAQLVQIAERMFRKHAVTSDADYEGVRFDILIADLSLACDCQLEYQRAPLAEFRDLPVLADLRRLDRQKKAICRRHAITRIELPCEWDGSAAAALDIMARQLVAQVNARSTWNAHTRSIVRALAAYRRKQRRKFCQQQASENRQLSFLPL